VAYIINFKIIIKLNNKFIVMLRSDGDQTLMLTTASVKLGVAAVKSSPELHFCVGICYSGPSGLLNPEQSVLMIKYRLNRCKGA
jgi:hypothetical protein